MSGTIRILAVIAIIAYVIGRQVLGEPLRGKRFVLLPVVLTVIGIVDISHGAGHVAVTDLALLTLNGALALVVGIALGRSMRLASRGGYLWGQLPVRALWWWALLIVGRLALMGVAQATHAHLAASSTSILLVLGINRVAQAAVVLPRAITAGVPFAPEKDGSSFLDGLTRPSASAAAPASTHASGTTPDARRTDSQPERTDHAAINWMQVAHHAQRFLEQRRSRR